MNARMKPAKATAERTLTAPMTALEEKQDLLRHHVPHGLPGDVVRPVRRRATWPRQEQSDLGDAHGRGHCPRAGELAHHPARPTYGLLHHNRSGKVIWLDDADSLYANMAILGLLPLGPLGDRRGPHRDLPVFSA
ncbi:MAG: hypothetical protein U0792_17085 [Gemmataceae bacterium]